jgi:hypothetical protein
MQPLHSAFRQLSGVIAPDTYADVPGAESLTSDTTPSPARSCWQFRNACRAFPKQSERNGVPCSFSFLVTNATSSALIYIKEARKQPLYRYLARHDQTGEVTAIRGPPNFFLVNPNHDLNWHTASGKDRNLIGGIEIFQ